MIRRNLIQAKTDVSKIYSSIGKDSAHWSFSKALRFKGKRHNDCPEMIELPSTLEKRSTSFGFGRRYELVNARGKDSPSPNKYNIRSCFESEKKGPILLGGKRSTLEIRSKTPGPGTYEIGTTICKDGPKFSFRPKFVNKERPSSPPPGAYNPRYKLQDKNNFSEITFGIGERSKETKPRPDTPGPGSYNVPSSFSKSCNATTTKLYSHFRK